MPVQEHHHRRRDAEHGPRGADGGARSQRHRKQRAAECAGEVHGGGLNESEPVLARDADDVQHHTVPQEVIESAMEERRAEQAPHFTCEHAVLHQGARRDDALPVGQGAGGDLPGEHGDVGDNQHQD